MKFNFYELKNKNRTMKTTVKNSPFFLSTYRKSVEILNSLLRKQSVVVFHTGRCGSTVLGNILGDHKRIYWGGEIFKSYNQPNNHDIETISDWIKNDMNRKVSYTYGFEIKYLPWLHLHENCLNLKIPELISLLKELNFSKFIILHRKNYLKHTISGQVGYKKQQWHSTTTTDTPDKITLDVNSIATGFRYGIWRHSIVDLFKRIDESYDTLKNSLSSDDCLFITYEDDIEKNPIMAYNKVCDFLDLPYEKPEIKLRPTNPFSYKEIIENFQDIEIALQNTKYAWMLND